MLNRSELQALSKSGSQRPCYPTAGKGGESMRLFCLKHLFHILYVSAKKQLYFEAWKRANFDHSRTFYNHFCIQENIDTRSFLWDTIVYLHPCEVHMRQILMFLDCEYYLENETIGCYGISFPKYRSRSQI